MTAGAKKWAHGLIGGFVGGAAGALDSSLALMALVPKEFNLGPGLKQTLTTAGVLGLLTGLKCAFAYLKQSPLPEDTADNDEKAKTMIGKTMAFFLASALAFGAFLGTGCKHLVTTDANGVSVTNSVPDEFAVTLVANTAKSAAYLGTKTWLEGLGTQIPPHPQDREKFELARTSVNALIAGGSFSAEDLTKALQDLPIRELQGENGSLFVGEAVTLWDDYGRLLAKLDKHQVFESFVLPVAKAISRGLDMALGPKLVNPSAANANQ